MTPQEDVRDHLNNFMDVVGKLEAMDVKIHPELLSITMLYSLPTNFDSIRTAIESRDFLPSPDNLKIKIVEDYEAIRQSEAFYTKTKKRVQFCKDCSKKGHCREACWSKNDSFNSFVLTIPGWPRCSSFSTRS
ncbi:unnamed protein product [Pieris brassicae]|uniref:Retrovirus-related Pol polyprotein from transposon TNT 1-94 n=1 Tax=Pieris brassicae TaxID=7116 RepID=A0A9P0XIX1_PIEBR|nr:unnamed protein product [Pieris brassicae]